MSTLDDIAAVEAALATLKAAVEAEPVAEPSLGDKVLEAVLPVLEAAGYTAPVPEVETPAEDATDIAEA